MKKLLKIFYIISIILVIFFTFIGMATVINAVVIGAQMATKGACLTAEWEKDGKRYVKFDDGREGRIRWR